MSIIGNTVGCYSPIGKTFIISDESGNEFTGVVTEQEVIFTATDNDVREGMVYASDSGVSVGTKDIPTYRTSKGYYMIFDGDAFSLTDLSDYDLYDYTELQCVIAPFNSSIKKSVFADKVVLFDKLYSLTSQTELSTVSKNSIDKSIDLNIINDSGKDYVIHYFTYREEV